MKRGGGGRRRRRVVWRRSRNNADARAATWSLLDTTARRQPLPAHPPLPFDFAPYVSSHRVDPRSSPFSALICIRPIMSSDSPSSSSSYLATIDQAPIVFTSAHFAPFPHLATRIGRLHAEDCSLVTTPHVHLLYARTSTLCGPSAAENFANERFSFYQWHCSKVENLPTFTISCRPLWQ